jgi:hypothetical protein
MVSCSLTAARPRFHPMRVVAHVGFGLRNLFATFPQYRTTSGQSGA